jgi:hypothetical protein
MRDMRDMRDPTTCNHILLCASYTFQAEPLDQESQDEEYER